MFLYGIIPCREQKETSFKAFGRVSGVLMCWLISGLFYVVVLDTATAVSSVGTK